jgi:BirA family biotin operon repressor/biotin-[acetyl-CoA-carboxylase] ligase
MTTTSDLLDTSALRKGLGKMKFGSKIYSFDTIDSTNNCAKALAGCWAEEGTVVLAESQTAGRGRLGRPWIAKPHENLIFSVVLRPNLPAEGLNLLPLYAAAALAEAIERETKLKVECKWPNDLLIGGRKTAGILLEGSLKENSLDYVVLGIGINVNQTVFPDELKLKATSLRLSCGKEIDRVRLLRSVLRSLESRYVELMKKGFNSILPSWLSRSTMINKEIAISQAGVVFSGIVKGLSPDGALILQSNGTEKTFFAGDVTIIAS